MSIFVCDECGAEYKIKNRLKNHKLKHHKPKLNYGKLLFFWLLSALGALIVGAYFSPILAWYMPYLDTIDPYVFSATPPDNSIVYNFTVFDVFAKDVGGSGLTLASSTIHIYNSKGNEIEGDITTIEDEHLRFTPISSLIPDTYTVEIIIKDKAGNVGQKTQTFSLVGGNLTVKPIYQPIIKNNKHYARFVVDNIGNVPLNEIYTDYSFKCFMNESVRVPLAKNLLKPQEDTYFDIEFQDKMDYKCGFHKFDLTFYKDKSNKIYAKCINTKTTGCGCCNVQVNVSAKEIPKIKGFDMCYPFYNISLDVIINKNCVTDEQIKTLNLTKDETKTISSIIFGLQEPCIRGELPLEWCKEQGIT